MLNMSLPWRPRAVPRCSACMRGYALAMFGEVLPISYGTTQQQVRGKKKMARSTTISVRLLKDVQTYGRRGAIVPVPPGRMRSEWFPARIAEYVTMQQKRQLRLQNVTAERDFNFGVVQRPRRDQDDAVAGLRGGMSAMEIQHASAFQKEPLPLKLTPERSAELVELFVPSRVEFYRQPIVAAAPAVEPAKDTSSEAERRRYGRGAAADLLAARTAEAERSKAEAALSKSRAIFGSVSTHDVLVAVRAAMAENDEAALVVLHDEDIHFVDLPDIEGADMEKDRVKHVGDFTVEIRARGAERVTRRTVRVVAQEA